MHKNGEYDNYIQGQQFPVCKTRSTPGMTQKVPERSRSTKQHHLVSHEQDCTIRTAEIRVLVQRNIASRTDD